MANLKAGLLEHGLREAQIHMESFTTATSAETSATVQSASGEEEPSTRVYIGQADATPIVDVAEVRVTLGGEDLTIQVPKGKAILETLIENGANPPYSCLEGNCMACLAKVREGRVYQNDPGILLDENIAAGETLSCQARPASARVHLDYDSI